jgi:hypothetical protein
MLLHTIKQMQALVRWYADLGLQPKLQTLTHRGIAQPQSQYVFQFVVA